MYVKTNAELLLEEGKQKEVIMQTKQTAIGARCIPAHAMGGEGGCLCNASHGLFLRSHESSSCLNELNNELVNCSAR